MGLKEAEDSKWLHCVWPCRLHVAHLSTRVLTKFLQWLVCISRTAYPLCRRYHIQSTNTTKGPGFLLSREKWSWLRRQRYAQYLVGAEHPGSWWVCVWDCHCNSASTSSRQQVCVRTGERSSNTKVMGGGGIYTPVLPMLGFHFLSCLSKILSPAFPSGAVLSASLWCLILGSLSVNQQDWLKC